MQEVWFLKIQMGIQKATGESGQPLSIWRHTTMRKSGQLYEYRNTHCQLPFNHNTGKGRRSKKKSTLTGETRSVYQN